MIFVDTTFFFALLDPPDGQKLARLHRTTAEEEAVAFAYLTKHEDEEYQGPAS